MISNIHSKHFKFIRRWLTCLTMLATGADPGGVFGVWRPPLQNTLGKQKEWCVVIKTHKNVLFLELNVILAVLKESIQFFLKGCAHHTPYTLLVKTTLIRKVLSICKHWAIFMLQKCNTLLLLGGCAPQTPCFRDPPLCSDPPSENPGSAPVQGIWFGWSLFNGGLCSEVVILGGENPLKTSNL